MHGCLRDCHQKEICRVEKKKIVQRALCTLQMRALCFDFVEWILEVWQRVCCCWAATEEKRSEVKKKASAASFLSRPTKEQESKGK